MIQKIFPFLTWFKKYNKKRFRADFFAGLTVALILIPQSMAYAQLANLPAYYGLYASFLPPIFASLFGSSRQLATGPVAIVSLMTAAALEPIATAGTQEYIAYAILLALLVGMFQFLLGFFKLGVVINFISHPIVNGFTNAGALIIATSQIPNLFGVNIEKSQRHYETIYRAFESIFNYVHLPTLIFAVIAFVIMIALRRYYPRVPSVLAAVVVTTIASWFIGFENNGTTSIGNIHSAEVVADINELNQTLAKTEVVFKKRLGQIKVIDSLKTAEAEIELIKFLEHKLVMTGFEIEELKNHASHIRRRMKDCLFKALKSENGKLQLYLSQAVPQNIEPLDNIWRLNIGNGKIDEKDIKVTGGGKVVGAIPSGLPSIGVPHFEADIVIKLIPIVIIISLIGFMEAISVAKAMAAKTGQKLDCDQELIGQGISNILGSFASSYPVSGSFSRSAVNLQSGAVTGLSGVITSAIVLVTLLFFTPLMYHLPQSVFAAIIMMAVLGLINVSGFIRAWKVKKFDGAVSAVTYFGTLAFAPHLEWGILLGVGLSLIESLYKHMRPSIKVLSKHEDGTFRDAKLFNLEVCRYIAVIRFNGSLFFASASYLEDKVIELINSFKELEHILIVGNGINELDATGVESLIDLVRRLRQNGIEVSVTGLNDNIFAIFQKTNLIDIIGQDHIYRNVQRAVDTLLAKVHEYGDEECCPLQTPIHIEVDCEKFKKKERKK